MNMVLLLRSIRLMVLGVLSGIGVDVPELLALALFIILPAARGEGSLVNRSDVNLELERLCTFKRAIRRRRAAAADRCGRIPKGGQWVVRRVGGGGGHFLFLPRYRITHPFAKFRTMQQFSTT